MPGQFRGHPSELLATGDVFGYVPEQVAQAGVAALKERSMCLAVPGRIVETEVFGDNRIGRVDFGGIRREALLDFVPDAVVGDYVLVHVGFAISKVDEEEARRTYEYLEQIGMLDDEAPS